MDRGSGLGHYHVYGADSARGPWQSASCASVARIGVVVRNGQSSVTANFLSEARKVSGCEEAVEVWVWVDR